MTDSSNSPSLYADILRHADERPLAIAAIDGQREISYRQFAQDIDAMSRHLHSLGLKADELVAISVSQPYLHWLVLIGLWRGGIISTSINQGDLAWSLPYFGAKVLITDIDTPTAFDGNSIRIDETSLTQDADSFPPFVETMLSGDHPLRLLLSSGTTGTGKQIVLTKRVIDARLTRVRRNPRFNSSICFMSLVNIASIEFFFSVGIWSVGGTVEFVKQPILEALNKDELKAQVVFMNTTQLGQLVNALPADRKPNRSMVVLVGGSIVPKEICSKAYQRLTGALMIVYGSTEAGTVAINPNPLDYADPGVCGFVVPDMEVQVINDAGHPVGDGVVGEVRLRSTSCVTEYRNDPATTRATFIDGWFYPGDLGKLSKNGLMTIVGRVGDIMNIGGWKVAPALVEEVLFQCAGVRDLAAFAVPDADGMDQLWVAVVKGEAYAEDSLVKLWNDSGAPKGKMLHIAYIDAIPRNPMGKVLRDQLVESIKAHQMHKTPLSPVQENLEQKNAATTVTINGREFEIDKLSEGAKAKAKSLQFIDSKMADLNNQLIVYQTARTACCNELAQMLKEDKLMLP